MRLENVLLLLMIQIHFNIAYATHSSILAWKIPWTEEPVVHGVTESDVTE